MQDQNEEFSIPLWHGDRNQDLHSIQKWVDNVQTAKGTTSWKTVLDKKKCEETVDKETVKLTAGMCMTKVLMFKTKQTIFDGKIEQGD